MMPILHEIYSLDGEMFYIYYPGTSHQGKDRFGNTVYIADSERLLDANFNEFVLNINKDQAEDFVKTQRKLGKNWIVGSCSPEIIDKNGDYVPNDRKDLAGVWKESTREQKHICICILERQKKAEVERKGNNLKKKLMYN